MLLSTLATLFVSSAKKNSTVACTALSLSHQTKIDIIAYFLRPENETWFKDMDGRKVKAVEWHDDKYVMFAEPHDRQERSNMLTGGMERNTGIMVK